MKLLAVDQARSIWLFPTGEINPSGKHLAPLVGDIVARHSFTTVPNLAESVKKNEGLAFAHGSFNHSKLGAIRIDFTIYNDGLLAETRVDTQAADAFLEDLLGWIEKQYGLHKPERIRKIYASKLSVQCAKPLNSLNPKLERIAKLLSTRVQNVGKVAYEISGIHFAAEQASPLEPAKFIFERLDKAPFEDQRYYSFAPLATKDHLDVLEQLEAILA